jgi:hypothetical protein
MQHCAEPEVNYLHEIKVSINEPDYCGPPLRTVLRFTVRSTLHE